MAAFFAIVFTLLLGLAIVSKLFRISIFKETPPGLPNGSMGYLPLLGETLAYLKPHNSTSLGSFTQVRYCRYGSVFRSNIYGRPTIVSCNRELNTFILQNEDKLFQTSYPKPVRDILGKSSMLHVSGDLHKKLRSVAVSFINASITRPDFLRYVDKLCASLVDSLKPKKQVFFYQKAKELTFFIMLKNLINIEPEDPLAAKLLRDFLTFMKGFVSLPLDIPGTDYSKAIKARRSILSALKEIIKKRENVMSVGDLLDAVMANDCFNGDQKMNILLGLLLAGYETTSGLIGLIVYFLDKAPSSLQRLQDEHQLLRKRKKDGEPLDWEDYKNMKFTSHVVNEALRCGNVIKLLHREAIEDVKFKEYTIPAGWQVLPVLSAAHLDPSLHQHPSEFNPWRWDVNGKMDRERSMPRNQLQGEVDARLFIVHDPSTSRKVTPFGGGVRICPASELARLEAAFFTHHLVLNLRWKTKEDECPLSCPYFDFKRGLELEIEQTE